MVGVIAVFQMTTGHDRGHGPLRQVYLSGYRSLSPFTPPVYLWGMVAAYVVSRLAEYYDAEIYAITGFLSGHSIKHIIAAGGTLFIYLALRNRQPVNSKSL